jgi:hypothetical protein
VSDLRAPHQFVPGSLPFWPGLHSAMVCLCRKRWDDPIHQPPEPADHPARKAEVAARG